MWEGEVLKALLLRHRFDMMSLFWKKMTALFTYFSKQKFVNPHK